MWVPGLGTGMVPDWELVPCLACLHAMTAASHDAEADYHNRPQNARVEVEETEVDLGREYMV